MKTWWILVVVAAVALAGCSGGKKDTKATEQTSTQVEPRHTETPPPIESAQPAETKPAEPAAPKPAEVKPETKPEAKTEPTPAPQTPPAAPATQVVKLPAGYEFQCVLDGKVSTETHKAGSSFQAHLVKPAILKTAGEIIPIGSRIRGEVTFSKPAERVGGKADMTLEYRELVTPDGKSYPIYAEPLVLQGEGTARGDIGKTVGGALGGAVVGGVLGGRKGAAEGAAAGAAAGAAWAIATRGNDIVIDPGQAMQVTLTRALHVTARTP